MPGITNWAKHNYNMEEKDIKVINTTKGELKYYRDWNNFDGGIVMINAQTVNRYREIKDQHPDADKCGVFFAFSNQQFNEGYKHLIELGHIKDGDKIVRGVAGAFGTKEGLDKFFKFYEDRDTPIKEECDPQEVYFYEYNNHESMIAWDGDLEAIKIVIDIWGADVARKIIRYNASMSVDNIIRKPIKIEGLYFNYNGEKKEPRTVWFSDVESEVSTKGKCHCMYDNVLYEVYTSNNEVYYNTELAGCSASYDGKTIHNFFTE